MQLAKLEHQADVSVGEEVYRALREAVIAGRVRPNERLVQAEVAAALGVSRQPVREALRRLEAEGLLDATPNRSSVASWYSREDIVHIYGLRARLEGYAAFLFAQHADPKAIETLGDICRAYRTASLREQDALNLRFHVGIIHGSRVPRVIAVASGVVEHALLQTLNRRLDHKDRERAGEEHEAILRALSEGNAEEAEGLIRRHMEWAASLLLA